MNYSINQGFTINAPGDGSFVIDAYCKDGVLNQSATTSSDSFIVDTTEPHIYIGSIPSYYNRDDVEIPCTAIDPPSNNFCSGIYRIYYRVVKYPNQPSGIVYKENTYPYPHVYDYSLSSEYLADEDGEYYFQASPQDGVLNNGTTQNSGNFIIDKTPPTAYITSPNAAQITSSNNLNIAGAAYDPPIAASNPNNFDKYILEYQRTTPNPVGWTQFFSSNNQVPPIGTLCNWNIGTPSTTDGVYNIRIVATDKSNNPGNPAPGTTDNVFSLIFDRTRPYNGSISINNGATYTTTTNVNLTLSASDNFEVTSMNISNTPSFPESNWKSYATSKSWQLTSGDGVKTVYVKFRDEAGNDSATYYQDSITYDSTPPTGTISINSGASYTNTTVVTLNLTSADNLSGVWQMCFSNDGSSYYPWETFDSTKTWTLSSGDGVKTVYTKYKDKAGNISNPYSDTITLDMTPPSPCSVSINNGDVYTSNNVVNLTLFATDNNLVTEMMISTDNEFQGASWEPYISSESFTFTTDNGTKWIYAKYKDIAGNVTPSYCEDSIVLDTVPPAGSLYINNNAKYTNSLDVSLTIVVTDTYSVWQMQFSNDGSSFTDWETFTNQKDWPLSSGDDGTRTVYVKFRDEVLNETIPYSDSIIYDNTNPSGSVFINSDATYTNNTDVSLDIQAQDSYPGELDKMMVSNDSAFSSSDWEPYSCGRAWTIPTGDGEKRVYIKFLDKAGNESDSFSDSIILDQTAPGGSILINADTEYTNNTIVSLSLTATDQNGVSWMIISADSSFPRADWEAFSPKKSFILPCTSGERAVFVKYKDISGNESGIYCDKIILDIERPIGSVLINKGVDLGTSNAVALTILASDNITPKEKLKMKVSISPLFHDTLWEPYSANKVFTLNKETGKYAVFVKFLDLAGNESFTAYDTVAIDLQPPTGSISINNMATYTRFTTVSLSFKAYDNYPGEIEMMVSNDSSFKDVKWETFTSTKVWAVKEPKIDGRKYVYVKYKDKAGNESKTYSDYIILDTTPPKPPPQSKVIINGGVSFTTSLDVKLSIYSEDPKAGYDPGSGVGFMRVSNTTNLNVEEKYTTEKDWKLSEGAYGTRSVFVKYKDNIGNTTSNQFNCSGSINFIPPDQKVIRMAGEDRYETAVEIAKQGWTKSNYVILAYGENFPDALAAAPLAGKLDCPILLVPDTSNSRYSEILRNLIDRIEKLKAKDIIILGSVDVIPASVEKYIEDQTGIGVNVGKIERIEGVSRYDTAAAIANQLDPPQNSTAIITTGEKYPDALSAGSLAAKEKMPILLAGSQSVPSYVWNTLGKLNIKNIIILGSTDVMGASIEDALKNNGYTVKRLQGPDRYGTARAIAEHSINNGLSKNYLFVTTGENFPDGLCGGPFAAKQNAPILLVRKPLSSYNYPYSNYSNPPNKEHRWPVSGFARDKNDPLCFSNELWKRQGYNNRVYDCCEASEPTADFVKGILADKNKKIDKVYIAGDRLTVSERISAAFCLAANAKDTTKKECILLIQPHPDDMLSSVGFLASLMEKILKEETIFLILKEERKMPMPLII